jgi:CDP-glucose 4,6-dehydratase
MAGADSASRLKELCSAFNFGPAEESQQTVQQLVELFLSQWPLKAGPGKWVDQSDTQAPHEAKLLNLNTGKAKRLLNWSSRWDFAKTVSETVLWYREVHREANANQVTLRQIEDFEQAV